MGRGSGTDSGISPQDECRFLTYLDSDPLAIEEESVARTSEFKILLKIALPVSLTLLVSFGQGVVDLAFVGHLVGLDALTAASLAILWMNVSSVFIPRGLNSAMSALCSHAAGAKNLPLVGSWLVVGIVIQGLALIPVVIAWWFTSEVLQVAGTRQTIADMAATFARWSIIYLYPRTIYQALSVWASAQRIVIPQLVVNSIGFFANLGFNALFVPWLGFRGSPIATSTTKVLQCVAFVGWILFKQYHMSTWPREGLCRSMTRQRVREYRKLAGGMILGGIMEAWQIEGLTLMASHISEVAVATHTSLLNLYMVFAAICFGTMNATIIRCGYHLGGGRVRSAKRVTRVSLTYMMLPFGALTGVAFFVFRTQLGTIFSGSDEVRDLAAELAPILGVAYVLLSPFYTSMATLQAQGRPITVAVAYFFGSWVVCFPVSYWLAFLGVPGHGAMGLPGIWLGLCCGYLLTTTIVGIAVVRSDWELARDEAVARSKAKEEQCPPREEAESEPILN